MEEEKGGVRLGERRPNAPGDKDNPLLQCLGQPHVDSFNFMSTKGMKLAIQDLLPVEFELPNQQKVSLWIENATINRPSVPLGSIGISKQEINPSECRQRHGTYKGRLDIILGWSLNDKIMPSIERDVGEIPIMLKSNLCNLNGMNPAQLVDANEHEDEWGGYFVVKGIERLVRMLLMMRSNYPIAIKRSSWKSRGTLFSDLGIMIRCLKIDQTSTNNNLHFVTSGTVKYMFSNRKVMYYAPLILIMKCLIECTDEYIYEELIKGNEDDLYYSSCVKKMLRELHEENLHTSEQCKLYLGKMFKPRMYEMAPWATELEVTNHILDRCILIHLNNNNDKFNLICFMTRKLFDLVQDKCKVEGTDAVMMQELLLGGHLYLQVLKEKFQNYLVGIKLNILKKARTNAQFELNQKEAITAIKYAGQFHSIEGFLSSGNIKSNTGLGLMQEKGLSIVVENINRMRYMSHFRSVHRGSFFLEMRTTEGRQLLPDAWGFICPVHTPDGAPCGLLNHLTMRCQVTQTPDESKVRNIPHILITLGMIPLASSMDILDNEETYKYPVLLDGRLIGNIPSNIITKVRDKLRIYKIDGVDVPYTLEIVLVPKKTISAQYPGMFLFTSSARMMRPVINLAVNKLELIGTFEQVYMDVAVVPSEIYKGQTTHMELSKTEFLSNLAQLIPMPDCNQSPRNMYQCQMGKQTMGTPCHTWNIQAETKLYRLQTPGTPLFRPLHYDKIHLDDFAMGTNAIVAVISYTGYDMEDAMIINKAAFERGFAHGSIYKSEFIDLKTAGNYFCRDPSNSKLEPWLDTDGLPFVGQKLASECPLYCYYDILDGKYKVVKFHGKEESYVDNVRVCGGFNLNAPKNACISYRIPRNPSVGDKFASRAGQKGICSQKWPAEDLPFTESGLIPDIVFNPHGFPSRMTIAMMIETMAGKSASIHGLMHDATPFKFNENDTAIDYFGRLLEAGGYNYYGTEKMYSGVDGREMNADIFFGVVYYQRLRHMVSDKWQVRSTGPVDAMTHQPIKGRRRGGGVRFGEMERDSLISHGASYMLQDRLFHCSDKTRCLVCMECGTLIGPMTIVYKQENQSETRDTCRLCMKKSKIAKIDIPFIYKYFVTQLAAVNINIKIDFN
ncbi:RNA polymerase I subunit Rpl135 [Arctopsyche grandis]|uniref:RNA polymerase I subunit Rpl135 n=1 Tax=Arctopsyche grandis TaxID=121162 RepID=UPI00406D924C